MESDFSYSNEAKATRYFFLKGTNNINFFVEDSEKEYEYEAIFERLFGTEYKIKTVFGVGGKQKLIERFMEFGTCDPDNSEIPNVYIADGDFDVLIRREDMINNPNFIYLKAYDIETYYIDEDAIVKYLRGFLKIRNIEAKKLLNYSFWERNIVEQGTRIFLTHCYVQKNIPEIKNVKKGPAYFIDEKTGFEREGVYQKYVSEIVEKTGVKEKDILTSMETIKKLYKERVGSNCIYLICGKFLMYSLSKYIISIRRKNNIDNTVLKWNLINTFDIKKLNYIKNIVDELVKDQKQDCAISGDKE